jgi:hypothetical protein
MSFNGSGTFLINTAGQPVVSGTVISSTAFNALTADLATGLSTAITKDGQTTVTANIPMSTYKFTGLGVGSAATDSANLSQVQSTVTKLLTSVSGADTITAVGAPVVAAYAAGQMFYFVATGDNTGAVTLNIDSLGAKAVTRDGSVALAAGDIKSGEVVVVVYDGTRFQVVSQLNSAGNATFANVSITSALNVGGVATFTANPVLSGGTANGVLYLNGSKVATSGTALTFDGTNLGVGGSGDPFGRFYGRSVGISSASSAFLEINAATGSSSGIDFGVNAARTAGITSNTTETNFTTLGATPILFGINGTEQMRLTSTGLGIGTSSPGYKLDVRGVTASGNGTITTGFTYDTRGLVGTFSNHALGFITNGVSPTMLLDTSGNLGIGTSSPAVKLQVKSSAEAFRIEGTTARGSGNIFASFHDPSGRKGYWGYGASDDNLYISNEMNAAMLFITNAVERARITSGGVLCLNTTVANGLFSMRHDGAVIAGFTLRNTDTGASTQNAIVFERNTTGVGVITTTNTATAYVTSSDRRLKNNIAPADNAGSVIDAIEVVKHDWKVGGHTRYGMIAQDLHSVAPEAVFAGDDGEELEKAWGVDYSKLVPMLVKEIQSLRARVAQLETK